MYDFSELDILTKHTQQLNIVVFDQTKVDEITLELFCQTTITVHPLHMIPNSSNLIKSSIDKSEAHFIVVKIFLPFCLFCFAAWPIAPLPCLSFCLFVFCYSAAPHYLTLLVCAHFFDVCSLQIVFASWHIYVCSRMCFGGKANWVICKRLWKKIEPTIPIWTLTHINTNTLIFQKEIYFGLT